MSTASEIDEFMKLGLSAERIAKHIGTSERAVRVHMAKRANAVTTREVRDYANCTYRQLTYWTSQGYLRPIELGEPVESKKTGAGSEMLYTNSEAIIAKLAVELIDIGFEVSMAFWAARRVAATGGLNHVGSGEPATVMVELNDEWKLVREVS